MKTALAIGVALLHRAPARAENPPAPQLLAPGDAMNMTDVATYFRWTPMENVTRCEIQIARDRVCTDVFKAKTTLNVRYHKDCLFQQSQSGRVHRLRASQNRAP